MDPRISLPPLDDIEDEEVRLQFYNQLRLQTEAGSSIRRREARRRRMAPDSSSSDSEPDTTLDFKAAFKDTLPGGGISVLTPNGSTPSTDEAKLKVEKLDPALVGMSVGLKNLYSGKEDKRGRFQWQTTIPEDVGKPAEDAETAKWASIVRNVKVYNDPRKVLSMHSIVVQSPLSKKMLEDVSKGYPGVTVGSQRSEFSGKFEPLIHRWTELENAIEVSKTTVDEKSKEESEDSDDKLKLKHAQLLQESSASEFKNVIDSSQDMKVKGVMTYEYSWTLFQPGSMVYNRQEGQDRVFKLSSAKYGIDRDGNHVFWSTSIYVDWDGTRFGTNKVNVNIPEYNGTRPISSSPAFPFDYHSSKSESKEKLIARGAKVESYAGSHYRAYEGMGWRMNNCGGKDKYSIRGRIVVDTYGWNRFMPNWAVFVTPFHVKDVSTISGIPPPPGGGFDPDGLYDDNDAYDDDGGMPLDGHFADEDEKTQRQPLTEEQKLICTHLLRGYSLKEKLWLNIFVNAVQEISFNTRAFESSVLPENQKELILGFTATQQAYRSTFDDVIEGKGRGIISLSCGPPGVGKTLTAESVAEEMKVPLYMMSAGDLGLDPRHIENKSQGISDMAQRWGAIVLLDEADVFLEERSSHELERNKLVSIFLRISEYYEGIMFSTTNRVSTFDQAFQSRIHISLDYKELSIDSRKVVWQNFLKQHNSAQAAVRERGLKVSASTIKSDVDNDEARKKHLACTMPHTITDREVDALSSMNMNGRQIKNVLKTAQLSASRKGEGSGHGHVMTVLDVTQHLHNATRENERTRASIFS